MEFIKRAKRAYIITSCVMILLGVLLTIFPETSLLTVCYILGAFLTFFGVVKLVGYFSKDLFRLAFQFDFALGIFALVAGILILIHPAGVAAMTPVIIGVFILMDGVFKLQTAFDARRFGLSRWWGILLLALLTGFCGLFLIIDPFTGAEALMILLGVTLAVDGIQNLIVAAYTVRAVRDSKQGPETYIEIDTEEEEPRK